MGGGSDEGNEVIFLSSHLRWGEPETPLEMSQVAEILPRNRCLSINSERISNALTLGPVTQGVVKCF